MAKKLARAWLVPESMAGCRLDRVLENFLPEFSLRGRRRLIAGKNINVNGQFVKAAHKVASGDEIVYQPFDPAEPVLDNTHQPCLLAFDEKYCFFYKPKGWHTVSLAGKSGQTLEEMAPLLMEKAGIIAKPRLLQRLDFGTSGIICAALDENAEKNFRTWEKSDQCRKFYLAILQGHLAAAIGTHARLDTSHRKKTGISARPGSRWTNFYPVFYGDAETPGLSGDLAHMPLTLAICEIAQGQRHQIRAHAAFLGHPLAGDALYGHAGADNFRLEHVMLRFPGHTVSLMNDNADSCQTGAATFYASLPPTAKNKVKAWLKNMTWNKRKLIATTSML